jgi:hypothetical protein
MPRMASLPQSGRKVDAASRRGGTGVIVSGSDPSPHGNALAASQSAQPCTSSTWPVCCIRIISAAVFCVIL